VSKQKEVTVKIAGQAKTQPKKSTKKEPKKEVKKSAVKGKGKNQSIASFFKPK